MDICDENQDEEAVVATSALLLGYSIKSLNEKQRRKRRVWVWPFILSSICSFDGKGENSIIDMLSRMRSIARPLFILS